MAAHSGAKACTGTTTSTTADTMQLTDKVNQVAIVNHEAAGADTVWVTVATGATAAAALAAVTTAAADADEAIPVLPQQRVVVSKTTKRTYFACSVVGNASKVSMVGTEWFD